MLSGGFAALAPTGTLSDAGDLRKAAAAGF